MPFIRKSLTTLLEREQCSARELAERINQELFSGEYLGIAGNTLENMSDGKRDNQVTARQIDILTKYAKRRGYDDLRFYRSPRA